MDNRKIDVTSEGDKALELAIRIIWDNAPGGKATFYKITKLRRKTDYYQDADGKVTHHFSNLVEDTQNGIDTLILYWTNDSTNRIAPLPYPLSLEDAINFIRGWLKESADYGRQPDHDGDNDRGWRVFTEDWGHVAGSHCAILAVQPAWAMYGK